MKSIKETHFEVFYDDEFCQWYVGIKGSDITSKAFETEEEAKQHLEDVLWGAPLY